MASQITSTRPFVPGTTGWTAADLDDPEIGRQWIAGRYEIVEGVLTTIAPAMFRGGEGLFKLLLMLNAHLAPLGSKLATEIDVVLSEQRVVRADAVVMMPPAIRAQAEAAAARGTPDWRDARILVPPTLIIESISPGHETHDVRLKRRWYADAGVSNYWLLNAFNESLECLVLHAGQYDRDQFGQGNEQLRPSAFPGLLLSLSQVWR